MSRRILSFLLGVALLAFLSVGAAAQMTDKVEVTLPFAVHVNDQVLQPGTYTFQEMRSRTDTDILFVRGPNNMQLEATVTVLDARDQGGAAQTELVLRKVDGKYYATELWLQGRVNGYEFLVPQNIEQKIRNAEEQRVSGTMSRSAPHEKSDKY